MVEGGADPERRSPRDERGQTLVEYALILVFVVLVATVVVMRLGPEVRGFYQHTVACFQTPSSC